MNSYEELCDEACKEKVKVVYVNMDVPFMRAAYIHAYGREFIFIDPETSFAERTCLLAEELGHHHTGHNIILRYNNPADWKAEARARRWACAKLVPPKAIKSVMQNTDNFYEIADALNVTPEFLNEAICEYINIGVWSNDEMNDDSFERTGGSVNEE